jgi:5-methylcytosine-specific restriction enzyme A
MPYIKRAKKADWNKRSLTSKDRQKLYRSKKWAELRASKLMYNPLCEFCLALNNTTPATEIHHKDSPFNYEGTMRDYKAYDYTNLISLCKTHHSFLHRNGTTRGLNLTFEISEWLKKQ